ncbi:MAG: tripartite tricarboxylate transporter TctB family protein [Desulfovibrio sp.]|jgi:hypothetical protein|nr:tripartite tricarboxylate transporter TctB family protein [Desulfovibrio sp.]
MCDWRVQYFIEFLVVAGFSLCAWLAAAEFSVPLPLYKYGADGWPKAVALCMAFSAACLFVYRLVQGAPPDDPGIEAEVSRPLLEVNLFRNAAVFGVPLLYALLLPHIGFYMATILFLPLYTWLLGERKFLRLGVVTGCTAVVIIVLFSKYLYVPFPLGNWGVFYDINSFISELMYR